MKTYTFAILGCGKLAHIVTDALLNGYLPNYKLIASFSGSFEKAENIATKINESKANYTCKACSNFDELLALKPDYIIETASPKAFKEFALPSLKNGSSIVTLSIGALADEKFYEEIQQIALENNTRVYLASGAIGGFDVMRTISLMEDCEASFRTEKEPNSLKNTAVYNDNLQTEKSEVFKGDAIQAINLFPTRVNVAVAASLASVGPKNLKVSINSTPNFVGDNHRIEIKSKQIHAVIDVYSKTAQIAGWSIVNTMRNIVSPIVF